MCWARCWCGYLVHVASPDRLLNLEPIHKNNWCYECNELFDEIYPVRISSICLFGLTHRFEYTKWRMLSSSSTIIINSINFWNQNYNWMQFFSGQNLIGPNKPSLISRDELDRYGLSFRGSCVLSIIQVFRYWLMSWFSPFGFEIEPD